jgi:hypothetical protein
MMHSGIKYWLNYQLLSVWDKTKEEKKFYGSITLNTKEKILGTHGMFEYYFNGSHAGSVSSSPVLLFHSQSTFSDVYTISNFLLKFERRRF